MHATIAVKPLPKTAQRLMRIALDQVAKKIQSDRMAVEDEYTAARSALAHLLAHDRYQLKVNDSIKELCAAHEALMRHPETERAFGKAWMQRLDDGMRKIVECADREPMLQKVNQRQMQIFVHVTNALIAAHEDGHWDPSDIIPPQMYVLARMVASNFEAYEKTLNT